MQAPSSTALALASADFPLLFAQAEGRLAALFRRILPVRLALVTEWAEGPLREQAALLQPMTELVLKFSQMAVPALLDAALESTREPAGVFGKLFRRQASPAQYKPALASAREQLLQLMADSEAATRRLEAAAPAPAPFPHAHPVGGVRSPRFTCATHC